MKNIKEKIKLTLIITPTIFLSWCLWACAEVACDMWWWWDGDHCYQAAAIQEADEDACDKIEWTGFSNSNPPKDKCYLLIAENTWDLSACDNIKWWVMSYTKEECILGISKAHNNPSWCMQLTWVDKSDCINAVWPNLTVWEALEMDKQIELLEKELKNWSDPELEEQLKTLEKTRDDFIYVLPDTQREKYDDLSDPLNKEIRLASRFNEIDDKTKESLLALNKVALDKWEIIPRKEYEAIRDMLIWKNDPKNDIEQMNDDEIVKLSIWEKAWKAKEALKFWKANPTEKEKKQDESLRFYQKMMEKQATVNKWLTDKQQEYQDYSDYVKKESKDYILWKINDELKKEAFWELLDWSNIANHTTAILWEALDVVKEHATSSMFRGMVWAYNDWMEEELANHWWNIEKAHAAVVNNLQSDAYRYEYYDDGITFAKYGNLMANEGCWPKNSNPLCLDKDVFFKAMKKSYKYQNQ